MQDNRLVELPYCGLKEKSVTVPLPVIVVPLAQDEEGTLVLEPEFGVPLPVMVMPLVHVHEPDGI
jgi:hypothetical protein